jgi:hypothetical protein
MRIRTLAFVLLVASGLAVLLLCGGCGQTAAVKQCRADLQTITQETNSYEAEYTDLYGPTVLSQRSINELWDHESDLYTCMATDPSKRGEYKAELYRIGFIESTRYLQFVRETKQLQDFVSWEKSQQETTLASYRTGKKQ